MRCCRSCCRERCEWGRPFTNETPIHISLSASWSHERGYGMTTPDESNRADFSTAFKQMASVAAISKTQDAAATLDELVKQCFVILEENAPITKEGVIEGIRVFFGLLITEADVARALNRLRNRGIVVGSGDQQLSLSATARSELEERIAGARKLELAVRDAWFSKISDATLGLDPGKLWQTLMAYLAQAFRRHGVQAVSLLNPAAHVVDKQMPSLSPFLSATIRESFPAERFESVRSAVASFFDDAGTDSNKARYITQLADGAFNYFSLATAPEVSEQLRARLTPLILFLDTNFLFGILRLHVNPQVDVSLELVDAIREFKLPFRLRYHAATSREMSNTLLFFGDELRSQRVWPQAISRAAVISPHLSSIELRYHEVNAQTPIEVEDFLAP
jgi:hypothetical protein